MEECGLFPGSKYGFRFSWSTAEFLAVVSDRIATVGLGLLDIDFQQDLAWWSSSQKSTLMEIQIIYLALFHLFNVKNGFEWFWMEILPKKYLAIGGIPPGSILGTTLF